MAGHKAQHVIPNCYLKAWCDPNTPSGQTPYIWRFSKDGSQRRNKSPEKSFTSTDRYTIRLPSGERDLVVEDTLSGLENQFTRLRSKIRREESLTALDRAMLCLFTAAMQSRTLRAGDHWKKQQEDLHAQVVAMEKQIGAEPVTSLQTAKALETAVQDFVMMSMEVGGRLLFLMRMSILVTDDPLGFITSDAPCIWRNPNAHKLPPFYRHSPGLLDRDIEITLPLTPHHLLLLSHKPTRPYVHIPSQTVDEVNRIARAYCTEEFVSWKGDTRPRWFEPAPLPPDAWENTKEGQEAMRRQSEWDEMRKKWERRRSSERSGDTPY